MNHNLLGGQGGNTVFFVCFCQDIAVGELWKIQLLWFNEVSEF